MFIYTSIYIFWKKDEQLHIYEILLYQDSIKETVNNEKLRQKKSFNNHQTSFFIAHDISPEEGSGCVPPENQICQEFSCF